MKNELGIVVFKVNLVFCLFEFNFMTTNRFIYSSSVLHLNSSPETMVIYFCKDQNGKFPSNSIESN